MFISQNKIVKTILLLGIAAFLLVGFFGLSHLSMNMEMNGEMSMADCPFMIGFSLCTMTPFQHISMWQNLFTNIPLQNPTLILLLLASALTLLYFWIKQLYPPPKNILRYFRYTSYQKYIPITRSFQELFSNGILNPKTF